MVQAYRLLINHMMNEFGECYPLHLGVTEAGDGEDGRIKSAIGIGTLLEDGIGDTIRVSLTEDPELEIPVCKDIIKRYKKAAATTATEHIVPVLTKAIPYDPFNFKRRETIEVSNIGGKHVPVVVADMSKYETISPVQLQDIGYNYDAQTDKWNIADAAADYMFTANKTLDFALPGTLKVILYHQHWLNADKDKYFPIMEADQYMDGKMERSALLNFVMIDCYSAGYTGLALEPLFAKLKEDDTAVICLSSTNTNAMQSIRRMFIELAQYAVKNPVVIICDSNDATMDESLIHYAIETGGLFLDGFADGICFGYHFNDPKKPAALRPLNSFAFGILQATRMRISKTEYISCPSCGRTLFDLQETTARIRAVTNHLKGVKIAIMGCIVNGPGEMADADFGYVGSGVGKITLYRGKEIVKRNVDSEVAVDELISLLKENDAWVEPAILV